MVEAKPLNDKELKYLIELQSEIPEQMKSETVDRLLNTIAALKASNARLIKAIEPFEKYYLANKTFLDRNCDHDEVVHVGQGTKEVIRHCDYRNLVAAKEGDDAK